MPLTVKPRPGLNWLDILNGASLLIRVYLYGSDKKSGQNKKAASIWRGCSCVILHEEQVSTLINFLLDDSRKELVFSKKTFEGFFLQYPEGLLKATRNEDRSITLNAFLDKEVKLEPHLVDEIAMALLLHVEG